jgi:uncharacterized membrane protein
MADAIEALGDPNVVTLAQISGKVSAEYAGWLADRRNARHIPYRLAAAGYDPVRNESAKDGYWKVGGKRQAVYARQALSQRDRYLAAQELTEHPSSARRSHVAAFDN